MPQPWRKKPFPDSLWYTLSCLLFFTLLALFFSVVPVQSAEIDKTECFELNRGRPYYDYSNQQTYSLTSLTNISTETFHTPLKLVITSITSPQVTVSQPDGLTADNKPYFHLTAPVVDLNVFSSQFGRSSCVNCQSDLDKDTDIDGTDLFLFISTFGQVQLDATIAPGERTSTTTLRFDNPDQLQFDFTIQVLIEGEDAACPVEINRERPYYDYANQQTYVSISVTNIGQQPLTPPIRTVVTTITIPEITVAEPDGNMNSLPYLDFSDSLGDGVLDPGETSQERILRFANPQQLQFDFTMLPSCQGEEIPNNPPLIIPVEDQQINEGSPLTIVVNGSDPDNDPLTFAAANLPTGAYFNPVSRAFNWTPSYNQAGTYQVTFSVVDSGGLTATDDVTIIVNNLNRRPIINPISNSQVAETKNLTFEVSGHDPDGDPLTFTTANLPTGAYFDAVSQTFTWTPPAGFAGMYQVRFTVSDGLLAAETATMITVLPYNPNTSPSISPIPVQHTDENQLLVYEISASDPNGDPLTWDTSGLPAGASVELTEPNTYEVHWQPDYDQAGSYSIVTTVTDSGGLSDVATVQVVVNNINRPPTLQPVAPLTIAETKTLTFEVHGSDPDNEPLVYTSDTLPAGAMFNPGERTFTWTPNDHQAGSYSVNFNVSDGSLEAGQAVYIEVIDFDPNNSPSWAPIGTQEIDEGQLLTFSISASDPDLENQNSLTITTGGMPTAATLEQDATAGSRVFSWQPSFSQAGSYPVTFTVTNPDNRSDILNVTILVHDVNRPPVLAAIDNRTTAENQAITIQAEADDPDSHPLIFSIIGLPIGAMLNPETGLFSWTPNYDQAGSYPMTWMVSDGTLSAQQEMTIEVDDVNRPPVILTTSIPEAHIDQEYTITISAVDPDGDPLMFTLSQSTAPLVTIDTDKGSLSWHPTMADIGTYQLTVQANDGRGGMAEQSYQLQLADTIPPAVSLNLPLQAHPGELITAAVLATDNDAVTAINVNGNRTDFSAPYQSQVQHQQEITLPTELGRHLVQATAWDSSGNSSKTYASIDVVATFDTTPPQVSLSAPSQAARGQEIMISALVSDNVGVASINFFANTTPIGTPPTTRPVLKYLIPETANEGDLITFRAEALDFSGNQGEDETVTTVVKSAQADTEAPVINAEVPTSIKINQLLPVTIETPNETCLASIEIIIHHTLAASYTSPDPGTFQIPLPEAVQSGMTVPVEINVTDCSGNQNHFESPLQILPLEHGVLAGEVYDDSTGLPLGGATITFFPAANDELFTTETDDHGCYRLPVNAGEGRLTAGKTGYTTVERPGLWVPDQGGLEVFDIRLTPLSNQAQAITTTIGGTLIQPFSLEKAGYIPALEAMDQDVAGMVPGEMTFEIPAGSLSESQPFSLHQTNPQGLASPLPIGWSPVGVVDIQPHGILLQVPGILTLPNHLGLDQSPILATWDEAVHAWRMIGTAEIIANGQKLQAEVDLTGQVAFLLPDQLPQPPPQPAVNELLQGTTPILIPETATTVIKPKPQVIFYQPGVSSDVATTISELTPSLPSGIPALIGISERYDFYTGGDLTPAPIYQDVRLYSYNQPLATAAFPVTPSWEFAPLSLNQGIIDVDLFAPLDNQRSIPIIGPAGGTISLPGGETLTFSEGSVDDFIPVIIKPFDPAVPDLQLPPSLTVLGGIMTSFFGQSSAAPATFSIPAPAGLNGQEQILLLKLQEVQGATHLALVGLGKLDDQIINSSCRLPDDNEAIFDGLRNRGRYLFAYLADELALVRGQVLDPDGEPVSGALITTDNLPIVAVSRQDGTYTAAVPSSGFNITTLDPVTMNSGTITGGPLPAGEILNLTLSLVPKPPTVISFSPADGQENVPLEPIISITFSEPLDPATVTAKNLICSGPQGPVAGTLSMMGGNSQVIFRPSAPLIPNTTYTFSISTNIKDLAGYTLETPVFFSFTSLDTLPPLPPAAATVGATIPASGQSTITATQGTAGPHDTVTVVNQTSGITTPVLVNDDGSFTATVAAELADRLVITITDQASNQTTLAVGAFRNPDGATVIGPEGGQLESNNNIILSIPPGAFPNGAIVKIIDIPEEDIGTSPGPDFPFVAGFAIESSAAPEIYLNASTPMPPGTSPDARGIVARMVEVHGESALAVVDTAKMIDGRLSTASPPCPGIEQKTGRYAMFLNNDQRMSMAQSLVSIVAQGMHAVTIEAFVEAYGGTLAPLYPFIAVAGSPGHAMAQYYDQNCLPVPPDTPLKVVVRDADTQEAIDYVDVDPIQPFEHAHFHFNVYNRHDIKSPEVIWTIPVSRVLNSDAKKLKIRFSEPVDYMSLLGAGEKDIYLTPEDNEEAVYTGTWQLLENNTVVVFETHRRLPMGKKYRLHLENIKDMAGNTYDGPPILFSTYKPRLIFPTASDSMNRNTAAAALGVDLQNIPDPFRFKDVDFITRTPDESCDGKTHTTLAAIQRWLTRSGAYRLFTFDATDPTAPIITGGFQTDGRFSAETVRLLSNIQITPREDAWADPQFWKKRRLYYSIADPSIRMCVDPDDPDQHRYEQWIAKNCKDEDGGCGIIEGGCGDLAVTTAGNTDYSYLWTYDVTRRDDAKWISSRLLSDNGVPEHPRRYEAPAGMGIPLGLSVLPGLDITHGSLVHPDTVGAYVANTGIGLELADLGLNIPDITDDERQSSSDYPWGYAETLQLNAQLYYVDVAVAPARVNADNSVVPPRVVAIASDLKDGTGIATLEIFRADLGGEPTGMVRLSRPPAHIAIATHIPVWEGSPSESTPHDIAVVSSDKGGIYLYDIPEDGTSPQKFSFIDTPSGMVTKYVAVDAGAMLAYVGASHINEATGGDGILIVDISQPFEFREDKDGDGWNDRIIGTLPITLPGYAGPVELLGFQVDPERGLLYGGVQADGQQPLVIAKLRQCPDLSIDFKAVSEPEPVPEYAEKQALLQVIENSIVQSGMPAASVAVLAYGDRACLWKGGCGDDSRMTNPRYRFAVLIPDAQWNDKDLLLTQLYQQVTGDEGEPKPVEAGGIEVTFDDIAFVPVKLEAFMSADPGLDPVGDDPVLAPQTRLLEMLLNGVYVTDIPELRPDPMPLDLILSLLTDSCDQGECATDEPSHIWRQEGYELAKRQKAAFLDSGALIRFYGEFEPDTTLYTDWREDLHEAARAALQAALARLVASEEGNHFVAFRADTYKGLGPQVVIGDSLDPDTWETTTSCTSLEQWIAATAALSVVNHLGVFTAEEIVHQVSGFQQVADGTKSFETEAEANAFIAAAWHFIEETINGFSWAVYQAKLMDDPDQDQRTANMTALEARIAELQQAGRKEIIPRIVNNGPQDITDIWCRMYEKDNSSTTVTERIRVKADMDAGSEMHLARDTFTLEDIDQTDTDRSGWRIFLLDIPDTSVEEPDRENNRFNLFYYILDPTDPSAPDSPDEPGLPVDDPHGDMLSPDPKCLCKAPELNITMSAGDQDTLELAPGGCADIEVMVENTGNAPLRDIHLYSTLPGMEDWTYDLPQLAAGAQASLAFNYCVPAEGQDNLEGYVWFEEMDEEYDAPPAVSNPLEIDVIPPSLNLIAKANGKDEIFVGKDWDVTFSVTYDQGNCADPVFFWDMGDGKGLFTTAATTYAYDQGGTYTAKVRITCGDRHEEDTVTVHVVEVEILANDTLDDPDISGDDGELDDAVRLKTDLPPGHPEGLTTRVFTTPCSVRLKHPLSKDASIMLKSSEARVGFANSGIENPLSEATWQLTLPKSGEPVNFAITGEDGSDLLNDARILAFLEDTWPPVGEEDLTVFWFDDAHIDVEVGGTYSLHPYAEEPGMWYFHPDGVPPPFGGYGVMMQARATLKPDGLDCRVPQISRIRIGITQNASDWQDIHEYYDPEGLYTNGSSPTVQVPEGMRITVAWKGVAAGQWLNDASPENNPLYNKCVLPTIGNGECPMGNPSLWNKPPTGCIDMKTGEDLSKFIWPGSNSTEYGTWNQDSPISKIAKKYPPEYWKEYASSNKPPLQAKNQNGDLVAYYRYQQVRIFRKEKFRCWVVTLERNGPWDNKSYPEEIIPLRENEWLMDVEYDSKNGYPTDIQLRRAQNPPGADFLPVHMPIVGHPYANEQVTDQNTVPFGGMVELKR